VAAKEEDFPGLQTVRVLAKLWLKYSDIGLKNRK
jgi:hypothetical protein